MSEIEPGIRFETDSVYGGSMRPEEWYTAEMDVDEEMPLYETEPDTVAITVPTEAGDIVCTHSNTIVVMYPKQWREWSHLQVKVKDNRDNMVIRMLFGLDNDSYSQFLQNDFSLMQPPEEPTAYIKEQHYFYARGNEPIEEVLGRIVLDGAE